MKKIIIFLITLLATTGARADELTVFDGTDTSGFVPVYGWYANYYNKCEFLMPASDLEAMAGQSINSMTFYARQSSVDWGASFLVFIKEIEDATITAFSGPGTIVYEGSLSIEDGEMIVEFSTPYEYNGGNLIIGIYQTGKGSNYSSLWYGQRVVYSSVQGFNYNSLDDITARQRHFLPKTTFTYKSSTPPIHELTPIYDTELGTVAFTVGDSEDPVTEAAEGDEMTITVTPASDDIRVRKIGGRWYTGWGAAKARSNAKGTNILLPEIQLTPVEGVENQWTFTMQDYNAEIIVMFWSNDDIIELIRLEMIAAAKILNVYGNTMNPAEITPIVIAINDAYFLLKRHEGGDVISIDEAMELYERLKAITDRYANIVTGIKNMNENENRYYDLQGRRVAQPTEGFYIKNGKVVMVK